MRPIVLVAVALLCGTAADLAAQVAVPLAAGDRVRSKARLGPGEFTVMEVSSERLLLQRSERGDTMVLAPGAIPGIEVNRGPRTPGGGALRGMGLGFITGAALGAVLGFADGDDGLFSAGQKAVLGAVTFGAAGAFVGGVAGSARPGERWERLQPQRSAKAPAAGPTVAVAVRRNF